MNLCWLLVKAKTKFLFDPGKKILAAGLIKSRALLSAGTSPVVSGFQHYFWYDIAF